MDKKSADLLKDIGNLFIAGATIAGALTLDAMVEEAKKQGEEALKKSASKAVAVAPPPKAPTSTPSTYTSGRTPATGRYAGGYTYDPYMILASFAPLFSLSYALNYLPLMTPRIQISPGFSFGQSLAKLKFRR